MTINIHAKSQELLETLANSIHDRDPKNPHPFTFNIADIHVAERWLKEFIGQINQGLKVEYTQPLMTNKRNEL